MTEQAQSFVDNSPARSLQAADFLLGAEPFVERCCAVYAGGESSLTPSESAALADAIRAGRPRIEIVEVVRQRLDPLRYSAERPNVNGVARTWDKFVVTDLLENFAPEDDEAFVRQVYSQLLDRDPSPIEAIEGKFDLKGQFSRRDFIMRLARRSPSCRLTTDPPPLGVGGGFSTDGKLFFNFITYARGTGWIVAPDVFVQPGVRDHADACSDDMLRLSEGWVIIGPKRSFPSGDWQLAIDLVQPERAKLVLDVVADAGLSVLTKFALAGPARLVVPFRIDPWHNFIELRLLKPVEDEQYRWLKVRQLALRQS